jgi:hypothetical protein
MDVITWTIVLIFWVMWGTKLHWLEGLWFEFKLDSWPMRTWYKKWGGTALGHGGLLAPGQSGGSGIDTRTEYHEHFHVEQFEALCLHGLLVALAIVAVGRDFPSMLLGACVWVVSGYMGYLASVFQAWIRGESAYEGSHMEEAAYSLTEQWERDKR